MGLFNFLYKLTNIFSNKRKLKVFLILAIILFIVFAWARGSFAAEPTPEQSQALTNYQLQLQYACFTYLSNMYRQGMLNSNVNSLANLARCQVYVNTSISDRVKFVLHLYNINYSTDGNSFTIDGSWSMGVLNDGTISGTEFPCKLAQFNGQTIGIYGTVNISQQPIVSTATPESFYLPSPCYNVRSTAINEFLELIGVFPEVSPTYNTKDEELQALTRAGFNSVNSNIQQQTQEMTNSIDNATSSITNSVDNLNNTITDTTTDDNQVQFAQDNNQDLTSGFFTNLFNSFQNAFTNNAIVGVEFNIPFTNKSFTFSNRYVRTLVEQNMSFQPIVVLATAFWWFALGYYVILDIYKKINAIKSGDLTNIENDNITTDLM